MKSLKELMKEITFILDYETGDANEIYSIVKLLKENFQNLNI